MTDAIRPAHYVYSDQMRARYKREPGATAEAFAKRALSFGLRQATLPQTPSLVSSSYGTIDAVLMTLPAYVFPLCLIRTAHSRPALKAPIPLPPLPARLS